MSHYVVRQPPTICPLEEAALDKLCCIGADHLNDQVLEVDGQRHQVRVEAAMNLRQR